MTRHPMADAALALAAAVLAAPAAQAAPLGAAYTVFVGNDQCPTNNSVTQLSGPNWSFGATIGVGNCPADIAFAPDGKKAYMINASDSTITPIDAASFTAGAAFPAGVSIPIFLQVTPDGKSIVTAGVNSNTLAVISTANTTDVKTVTVGASPLGVAVLPDSSAVYVANNAAGTVSVVSLVGTPALVKTITFKPPGCTPYDIAATPDGKRVYAACMNGPIWRINVAKNKADASPIAIPQGSGTVEVAITPDSKTAYVSNTWGAVYPVTLKTGVVGAAIPVPGAYGLAMSPDGKVLLVGNGDCCFVDTPVSVVSTKTNTVVDTLPTGGNYVHRWLAFKP